MRIYLLAAVAAAAIATPAFARNGSGYIGIEGGASIARDTDLDIAIDDGVDVFEYDDALSLDYKSPGIDLDLIAGYDFGMIRAEAELGWKRLKVDHVEVSDPLLSDIEDATGQILTDDDFDVSGKVSVLSGMANVLFDIGDDAGWGFYAGGGAGRARVKAFGDKDSAWAWQLIAGVRTAVSDQVDLGLKYRFFNTGKLDFSDDFVIGGDTFGVGANGKLRTHSLLLSMTYNFAGSREEAAPPPPPPPPPPPAPATQTCPDGSVISASDACPPPPPPPPMPDSTIRAGERGR